MTHVVMPTFFSLGPIFNGKFLHGGLSCLCQKDADNFEVFVGLLIAGCFHDAFME